MVHPYKSTRLWITTFENPKHPELAKKIEHIYATAWDRSCSLAKRIALDAHGLTLHDEAHFTELWKCADLICGSNLKFTPVELLVFGVAVLIHDAAHTVIAYEGGINALIKTAEWADAVALLLPIADKASTPSEYNELPENSRAAVLFQTVRALHAKQAEKILSLPFKHPALGTDFFILEDAVVRTHIGGVMGEIAASHHWNLAKLESLGKNRHVVSPYDAYGPIRPILLGALMRTADATQINSARAPDFEFALSNPTGLSHQHWSAQNKLAIGIDEDDSSILTIDSTVSFRENEASAWWIAFELANVADKELRETDQLLQYLSSPRFQINRVRGAGNPLQFAERVKAFNWEPVEATIKIDDPAKLIEVFGGKGLYGNDEIVPIRELLQNAVDAIRARRVLEPGFQGQIGISLESGENARGEDGYWLKVSDDGIGMSPAILAGPFLTFGQSGWTSAILRSERPGFIGRRFDHIGRFGIGFFSVFMIGDEVKISTRPFDAGHAKARTLHFYSGLGLRPILKGLNDPTSTRAVTTIECFISAKTKENILHRRNETMSLSAGEANQMLPATRYELWELIGMLCPAIDVEICVEDVDSSARKLIAHTWATDDAEDWISRIHCFAKDEIPLAIRQNPSFLEVVGPLDRPIGRATLNPTVVELAVRSIGGLANKKNESVSFGKHFVGCLDGKPNGPRRDFLSIGSSEDLVNWANRQVEKWASSGIADEERNLIAANATHFGGDPMRLANAQISGKWLSLPGIFELLNSGGLIVAPIESYGATRDHWKIMKSVNLSSGLLYHPDDIQIEAPNVLVAGNSAEISEYWVVLDADIESGFGFLNCLERFCASRNTELDVQAKMIDFGSYRGESNSRFRRMTGMRLVLPGVEITLARH